MEKNIADFLFKHACFSPYAPAFIFLKDGEREERRVSFSELQSNVELLAGKIAVSGLKGERVLLIYQDAYEFIVAFLCCQYLGIIAVPVSYARGTGQLARLERVIADADVSAILCIRNSVEDIRRNLDHFLQEHCISFITTDVDPAGGKGITIPKPVYGKISFIQYTSGSTSEPKGVVVSHKSLLINQQLIKESFGCRPESVILSWLPFHHDMGLVGNILHTIYIGCSCVIMSPLHFIQQPRRWLQAITHYKVTHSGGPNFSFDLCMDKISREEMQGFDLSSWRVAYNGSEPVRAETLERFSTHFAQAGFRMGAFCPCYGLAEATLLVSGKKTDPNPLRLAVDKGSIGTGKILTVDDGTEGVQFVISSGLIPAGMEVSIVSGKEMTECGELEEGEICISGRSVSDGYWNRNSQDCFYVMAGKRLFRTGDLGFFYRGELFVHGRLKEMLIIRGRNYYPYDIELLAWQSHDSVEPNGVVVFGGGDSEEHLVVVAELKRSHVRTKNPRDIIKAIDESISGAMGVSAHDILLTTPGAIPRTTSGKRQRVKSKAVYNEGGFRTILSKAALVDGRQSTQEDNPVKGREVLAGGYDAVYDYIVDKVGQLRKGFTGLWSGGTHLSETGMDSLTTMELVNKINTELGIQLEIVSVIGGTIDGLVEQILALRSLNADVIDAGIPVAISGEHYPASGTQKSIWAVSQLEGGAEAYNIVTGLYLRGPLEHKRLERSFSQLIRRHESLCTRFEAIDGIVCQIVKARQEFGLEFEDCRGIPDIKAKLEEDIWSFHQLRADLEKGLLLNAKLFQLSDEEFALMIRLHHIVGDGWSIPVLVRDVLQFYYAEESGGDTLRKLRIQYKDYSQWIDKKGGGEGRETASAFWKNEFSIMPSPLVLPYKAERPSVRTFRGGISRFCIPAATYGRIGELCRDHGVTIFHFIRASVTLLLHKFSGQQDITVGTPVSGRVHAELAEQIGLYVNTLPLRIVIDPRETFSDLLGRSRDHTIRALGHGALPFERIVEDLGVPWDAGRSPLFDVLIVLQDSAVGEGRFDAAGGTGIGVGLFDEFLYGTERLERTGLWSKFDLSFGFLLTAASNFFIEIEYSADLFTGSMISGFFDSYLQIVMQVLDDPERTLSSIEVVTPAEKKLILERFNPSKNDYRSGQTLVGLLEEQARKTADAVAILFGESLYTYREINERANRLADHLRKTYAIGPNDLVGVYLERDAWMVIALIGILKAGGAYVPIDKDYPRDRIDYILANSACRVVLDDRLLDAFRREQDKYSVENPSQVATSGDLAYVIYTSGSTGRPKGVAIEHRNTCAFIDWCDQEFGASHFDVVFATTSICFDLSVFEIFYSLSFGKTLRILKDALSVPEYLACSGKVLLNTVPSVVGALQAGGVELSAVSVLNMAGEPIPPKYLWGLDVRNTEVRNLYGPSEDTTYSTIYRIGADLKVSIGKPIANTELYILDPDGCLQPIGVVGEICLSGAGLSRGYLNNDVLTADRFVKNPFRPGERMYRTGDLGRWQSDGNVEYIGRLDNQVKIRGYRVELGEIEQVLHSHTDVLTAVAGITQTQDGDKEIVAYIVSKVAPDDGKMHIFLRGKLPAYMLPVRYVWLDQLPLTPNGKVNRNALPEPQDEGRLRMAEYKPPGSPTEVALTAIWEDILDKRPISIRESFQDLGGHSLKASLLAGRIHRQFGIKLEIRDVFVESTIERIATRIDALQWIKSGETPAIKDPEMERLIF